MAKTKNAKPSEPIRRHRPALTPEARWDQLASLAIDLVEQRLLDGTASSQETTQFLKEASLRSRLELEKLRRENELLTAKTESLESSKHIEELYAKAIEAFKGYSGNGDLNND